MIDMEKRGKGFHRGGKRLSKMEKQSHLLKVTHRKNQGQNSNASPSDPDVWALSQLAHVHARVLQTLLLQARGTSLPVSRHSQTGVSFHAWPGDCLTRQLPRLVCPQSVPPSLSWPGISSFSLPYTPARPRLPSPLPRPLLSEGRACLGMGKEERTKVEGRGESNPALSPSRCTALSPSPPTYFPQGHWRNPSSCHPGVRVGGEGVWIPPPGLHGESRSRGCTW